MPATAAPNSRIDTRSIERLDQLAWLMDRAFGIPGTKIRVGLDALLGLIPVGGDAATGLIQAAIVLVSIYHYKVPRAIAGRMAANVLLDVAVGAIPLLGDAFDVGFKANTRNIALLRQAEAERVETGKVSTRSSVYYLAALTAALVGAVALAIVGFITLVRWAWNAA